MIDLAGIWRATDEHGEYAVDAHLPGDIHSALIASDVIADPFWARGELDVQWIGRRGWTVERDFVVDDPGSSARWLLEIDTVDTIAEIFINGTSVARCVNMFVPLRVDVGEALKKGSNTITVRFESAEGEAVDRAERLRYPIPHSSYPVQSPHRNLVRTVQCHSGWDWGPCFMVSGLYGTLRIRPVSEVAIRRAWGIPRREAGDWVLPVHVTYDGASVDIEDRLSVALLGPDGVEVARQKHSTIVEPGYAVAEMRLDDPELWWPAGYGAQPLYTVEVRFEGDARRFRTAFREVEVVSEADEHGRSMFFRVNGRAVWAKGANWIPTDAFPSRQTEARYRSLLLAARSAHMNMIRVWGGGQYESDYFYDLCDELGILIWQDFMFSCSLYPSEEWFLEEVREEVRVQMRRLISHPSIAIWCGNNENIGALGWYPESVANPGRYLIDFDRLNHGVVGREVRAADRTRTFWPSSPAAGEGDFSDNWHDDSAGDMHYWSVWHEGKPFSAYLDVTPRFCSEFGFQSFPSLPSIRQFAPDDQMNPTAPDMEHHQRNPRGNTVVAETMARYFRLPFDFGDFVYLSQVQQAMAIGTAVDFWRSRRPVSMGALYWQLNDLWPVVSWSSIEYDGRWKLLHYEARRFFAPRSLVCLVHEESLEVHLLNDTVDTIRGTVAVRGLDWRGGSVWERSLPVEAPGDASTAVLDMPLADLPFEAHEGFIVAEWRPADSADAAEAALRGWTLLTEFKRCELARPTITVEPADAPSVDVRCADAPAFWVTLEGGPDGLQPDDGGFLLLPGETRTIEFVPIAGSAENEVSPATSRRTAPIAADTVAVRHIRSIY
ncbi:MAG: glycoside hydrolase family 2 protein [Spirochaetales bacterium]|nr:glycoside hydrolase family 2 protein [Spirochaetales bacterium]